MMRRAHSDTAINFYPSAYCRELLDTAHPTRFSKEQITYGSDIWLANTLEEKILADNRVGFPS